MKPPDAVSTEPASDRPSRLRLRASHAVLISAMLLGLLPIACSVAVTTSPAYSANGWITQASVSKTSVAAGQSITLAADVTANRNRKAIVDVEVYAKNGTKVFQRFWASSFEAGRKR